MRYLPSYGGRYYSRTLLSRMSKGRRLISLTHSVQQMSHVRSFQQGIWLYVEILYIDVYIAGFDLYMAGRTYGGKPPPPPMTGNDVLLFIKESKLFYQWSVSAPK